MSSMLEEVLEGLSKPQKTLPSKYFYDEKGSELFDQITELDEYYPTRTEVEILQTHFDEIAASLGESVVLIEPGSGSSEKTKQFLDRLTALCCYIPMDISGDYLDKVARRLQDEYPDIDIKPLAADYTKPFTLPDVNPHARKVVYYPGSTIGNFERYKVERFLGVIHNIVGDDGGFLIGVDLKKEESVLYHAYNDSEQVTAAFNKNLLTHLNRKLESDFNVDQFAHEAIWNEELSRIEMHLISRMNQAVRVNGSVITFKEGETIHTENSHKYTIEAFAELVAPWFEVKKVWTDHNTWFSIQYLEPRQRS
ncbi:MAG: L-histidine N(alpha)-methyltransferase [Bacteroidota bacterium]